MNKEQILFELNERIKSGEIKREEIISIIGSEKLVSNIDLKTTTSTPTKNFSINTILYSIGAVILFAGLGTFISQVWNDLNSFLRILITLGSGFCFALAGTISLKKGTNEVLGQIFHAIGGLLIPTGGMILLNEILPQSSNLNWPITGVFGLVFVFYFVLLVDKKNVVLTLFTILNGTAFIYSLTHALIGTNGYLLSDIYKYLTMIIGLSYLMLAKDFEGTWNSRLSNSLYALGTLGILGAGYSKIFDSGVWQMLYFVLILGGFYLSIWVKNRTILALSTIFLIAQIAYITGKYFADSLGWPISLMLLGFIFIGLGYMSVNISRTYIQNRT